MVTMEQLHTHLTSTFPQCFCLQSTNSHGDKFLRIIPVLCDGTLVYYPLVELRCLLESNNDQVLQVSVISFKREVLERVENIKLEEIDKIDNYVQLHLLATKYRICQGLSKARGRHKYLSELWKDEDGGVKVVFRSKSCNSVYPVNVNDDDTSEKFICQSCFSSPKPKAKKVFVRDVPQEESPDVTSEVIEEGIDESEDENLRVCPEEDCGRTFKRRTPFLNHLKTHQPKEQQKVEKVRKKKKKSKEKENAEFVCDICKFSFNYEKSYYKHLKKHDIFICTKCKDSFDNEEELKKHIEVDHRKKVRQKYPIDREVNCDECEEVFDNLNKLAVHNKEKHGIEGDPCPICGKYLKRSSMRNHIEKVHNSDKAKKYTCEECGKVYKTKTDLDTHYTKHTGEKLYTCPTCGKSYRFWNGLDDCQRRHDNDMRYKCNWQGCDKGFNNKFRFDQHMRTHDGVKPFHCPLCPYNCSRKDNLLSHVRRSHKKTNEEIKLLNIGTFKEAEIEV